MSGADGPLRTLCGDLSRNTTAHGVPRIVHAKGRFKQAWWSVLCVASFGLMVYHLSDRLTRFFLYPVHTQITVRQTRVSTFPAVTVCNMNPLRRSAIIEENPQLASILHGVPKADKRRRKRELLMNCQNSEQVHIPSGLCFGLASDDVMKYDTGVGARLQCRNHHGSRIALPNTRSKFEFIRDSLIFNGTSSTRYWIGIRRDSWADEAAINLTLFHNFNSGHPDSPTYGSCVTADMLNAHRWESTECAENSAKYLALCQQMYQCPWPVYRDVDDDICFFLFDTALTMSYTTAKRMCDEYAEETTLAILNITEKLAHIIASGILSEAKENTYWMFLKDGKWNGDDDLTWSNWASGEGDTSDCGMGHSDLGHHWTNEGCNSAKALALCEWRAPSIPYVAYMPSLSAAALSTTPSPTTHTENSLSAERTTLHSINNDTTTTTPLPTSPESTTFGQSSLDVQAVSSNENYTLTSTTNVPPGLKPTPGNTSHDTTVTRKPSTPSPSQSTLSPVSFDPPRPLPIPGSVFPERIQVRQEFQEEEQLIGLLSNIPEKVKSKMGYGVDDFVVDCQFDGFACQKSDFSTFYNGIHGNCYTFNSGWNKSVPIVQSKNAGHRYGLKMVLNIIQEEYTRRFEEVAGARVVLHSQDKMPFPEDEGIMVQPGYLTSVGIRKVFVSRLPWPYGRCTQNERGDSDTTNDVYQEIYPVNYSKKSCLKTCYQRYVIEECLCADPHYPSRGRALPKPSVRACDPSDIKQDDCKYNVTKRFMQNLLACDCPIQCKDIHYMPEVSATRWPADNHLEPFLVRYREKIPYIYNNADERLIFRRNFLKLEVFYEDLNSEILWEKASYSEYQFLSDIGGALGLWLGLSVLTTFEFCELAIDIMLVVIIRLRGKFTTVRCSKTRKCDQTGPTSGEDGQHGRVDAPRNVDMVEFNVITAREDKMMESPPPSSRSDTLTPVE